MKRAQTVCFLLKHSPKAKVNEQNAESSKGIQRANSQTSCTWHLCAPFSISSPAPPLSLFCFSFFFFLFLFLMVRGKDSIRPWRIQTTVRGSHSLNAECLCYCQRTSWKTNVSFFWVLLSDAKVIKTLVVSFVRTMRERVLFCLRAAPLQTAALL